MDEQSRLLRMLAEHDVTGSPICECGRRFGTHREMVGHRVFDHKSVTRVDCPCGKVYSSPTEFHKHKRRCGHFRNLDALVVPVPKVDGPKPLAKKAVSGPTLQCREDDCGLLFDTATKMNDHTTIFHDRRASREERTPI